MIKKNGKRIISLIIILGLCTWLYVWLRQVAGKIPLNEIFSSKESLQAFVNKFDPYGPLVFFIIQTAQVIFAPIPGNVTALAGGALFGLWNGFFLSTAGLITGSSIAFWMARFYGRPLVEKFVSPKIVDKYLDSLASRNLVFLFLLFLFPFFPDDALCFIAGLSSLPFSTFFLLVIAGRPPGMFFTSLVGSGFAVIPWWGWAVIIVTSLSILYIAYKYRDVIEKKLGVKK